MDIFGSSSYTTFSIESCILSNHTTGTPSGSSERSFGIQYTSITRQCEIFTRSDFRRLPGLLDTSRVPTFDAL